MKIVLILYNIRSLYNVGSIFRTADGAGVEKIYLCGITPAPVDRFGKERKQLTKVSLGAEKYVEWQKVNEISKLVKKLKQEGYKIFAVEQDEKSKPYYRVKHQASGIKKVVLIFGNEVKGIPSSILEVVDGILEIPMSGKKESLNVSVAAGVVLFRLRDG